MKTNPKKVTVRELVEGYIDDDDNGVVGYNGNLDIRPEYQREFVYKDKQREAVLRTVKSGHPLNLMWWGENDDGTFEVIDGQQRTISICQFVAGDFSIKFDGKNEQAFHNLEEEEQKQILDYELMVYTCSGSDKEKLEWFEIVNIAGEKLSPQELRNAVYRGTWLSAAKQYFSKRDCPANAVGGKYLKGSANRQEYLETAIDWISDGKITHYMSKHQHDSNANDLWLHFNKVVDWIKVTFPTYRKEMKGLPWGELYQKFSSVELDPVALEAEIKTLLEDEEITRKKGVYQYALTRDERHISLRTFSDKQKREMYERQGGICPDTNKKFDIQDMQAEHIVPWSKGGKTIIDNGEMISIAAHKARTRKQVQK